jgi:hypothetical protein
VTHKVKTPTRHRRPLVRRLAASGLLVVLGACGGGGQDLLKAPTSLVTGAAETLAKIKPPTLPVADLDPTGSPTEIYTRVARGVTTCWFGAHGTLKPTHILHAEAEPPSRGGRSELVIHEKDLSLPNPRGNRAFRVSIIPTGETATLEVENVRFPLETGQQMRAAVRRWSRGDLSCADSAKTEGWAADNTAPEPAKPRAGERRI